MDMIKIFLKEETNLIKIHILIMTKIKIKIRILEIRKVEMQSYLMHYYTKSPIQISKKINKKTKLQYLVILIKPNQILNKKIIINLN